MAHYPKIFDFTGGGGGTPSAIDSCEITWGTGTGITSSNYFLFDSTGSNLIQQYSTGPSICASTFSSIISSSMSKIYNSDTSSIIGGKRNIIRAYGATPPGFPNPFQSIKHSLILGGSYNCISYSSSGYYNIYSNVILSGRKNLILESDYATIIGGSENFLGAGPGENYVCHSTIIGGKCNCLWKGCYSSIISGACNQMTAMSGHTMFSTIITSCCSNTGKSDMSSIISSYGSTMCNSLRSSIISSSASTICSSKNSVIIGGYGMTISSENDVIYLSTLKIDSVTQSIDSTKVLIWDNDKCVRYTTSVGGKSPIDVCEIAWGTGEGITSSNFLLFDYTGTNLIMGGNTSSNIVNSGTNSVFLSSIIGGKTNTLEGLTASSIIGGSSNTITRSCYASTLGGKLLTLTASNYSVLIGGSCNCICTNYSTIINGKCNQIKSCNSTIISGCCNCITPKSYYSQIIGSRNYARIDGSPYSTILGGYGYKNAYKIYICSSPRTTLINTRCSSFAYKSTNSNINNTNCSNISKSIYSIILGGCRSCIYSTSDCSLLLGDFSCIGSNSKRSTIISGFKNRIYKDGRYSTTIAGCYNDIAGGSCDSIILQGCKNCISSSKKSSILNSDCSLVSGGCYSTIISSFISCEKSTNFSSIIGTSQSCICGSGGKSAKGSSIQAGVCQIVDQSSYSSILGGLCHKIITSTSSIIIGGSGSCICSSKNSAILGGLGLTLSNEHQVVYLPELKINKVDQCTTLTKFLAWDDTNNYVRWGTPGLAQGITGSTPYYTGSYWTYSSTNVYNDGNYVGIGITNSNDAIYATPSSNLHVFGSLSLDVKTASTDYTLNEDNFTLIAYSPAVGGMTVSLPSASLAKHRVYVIKKADPNNSSFVFISPTGSNTIEGYAGSITLESQWDYNILQSDGVNMWIKLGGAVGLNL